VDRREGRIAGLLVWAVSLGSFATQMLVTSPRRSWSWDEAIYLSQVTRDAPALPFVASRARGISLLVAPLSSAGAPDWLIRLCLAAASSLVLAVVFRLWVPRVGMAAAIGAFLFAAAWPSLFYGSEVMPNLWAALFGVGVVACLARSLAEERPARSLRAGLVVFAALMALMRPPDALVLGLALGLGTAVSRRRAWRTLVPLGVGVALGWSPWLIEMSVRFGGPVEALRSARAISHLAGNGTGLLGQLALTDGPLLGPDAGAIPIEGMLWWGGLTALTVVALAQGRRTERALDVRLAAIGGAALTLEYLVLVTGLAPRFLLPALALLSLTTGCGLEDLRRARAARRTITAAAVLALAAWTVWQVDTLRAIEDHAVAERALPRTVGVAIHERLADAGEHGPCLVVSARDYPQVAFAARCRGRQLAGPIDGAFAGYPTEEGESLVFLTQGPVPERPFLQRFGSPAPRWFAYRFVAPTSG
jgi:hypothetical protein